jgi:multidrug efflux system outer membrane protein
MSILRRSRVVSVFFAVLVAAHAGHVEAQPAPAAGEPPPSGPTRATPPAPGVTPPTNTQANPAPQTAPTKLQIDDPMLIDVPPAQRTLTDWRQAVSIVSTRDVEYAIGLQEVERARGVARQALAPALPQADATGSVIFHLVQGQGLAVDDTGRFAPADVPLSPVAQAQLTVTQQILAPRIWYGIGTADAQVELAKLSVQDRRRTLLAGAASSIVAVVTAERVAEINRVGLRAALERLELTKKRTAIGSGTQLDVVRFEQDVAIARATLVQGDESLRQSRENLGLALGENETYGVPPGFTLDGVERDAAALCKPTSANDRADILAARKSIEIAERAVTDADLRYLPTAQVSTTATYASQILQTTKHYAWSIQGLLTIPIWDGGERYGAHRSAIAETEQARLRAVNTTRGATIEVNRATRAVDVTRQALDVAKKSRDLAADVERLSRTSFEVGAGTSFDLVDASRRLREAELTLAVRELDLIQAKISALLAASTCQL